MRTQSDRGWVLEALCRAPPVLLPVTYARRAEAVCEAVHIGCVGARLIVACTARRRAFDRIRRKNLYLRAIVWGDVLTRPLDGQEGSASLPLMLRERRLIRHDAARTP